MRMVGRGNKMNSHRRRYDADELVAQRFLSVALGLLAAVIFGMTSAHADEQRALVDYINPIIGADTEGKTFPGPTTPFGLVQLSPDTITGGDNGSGYAWGHKTIE